MLLTTWHGRVGCLCFSTWPITDTSRSAGEARHEKMPESGISYFNGLEIATWASITTNWRIYYGKTRIKVNLHSSSVLRSLHSQHVIDLCIDSHQIQVLKLQQAIIGAEWGRRLDTLRRPSRILRVSNLEPAVYQPENSGANYIGLPEGLSNFDVSFELGWVRDN